MDTKGRLWALNNAGGERRIPPLGERPGLLQEVLQNTAFPSGAVLYEHLRPKFYWQGIWGECAKAAASSPARQKEMARFLSPPYLLTTEQLAGPLSIWAIDTIVGLTPVAPDGAWWVIGVVNPFTR